MPIFVSNTNNVPSMPYSAGYAQQQLMMWSE